MPHYSVCADSIVINYLPRLPVNQGRLAARFSPFTSHFASPATGLASRSPRNATNGDTGIATGGESQLLTGIAE
jgi:hypothetical protein